MSFGDTLRAIGADSTTVNAENKNGAIRLLKCLLKRPLHWFICSLHVNELPLRHLCKKLIGLQNIGGVVEDVHGLEDTF